MRLSLMRKISSCVKVAVRLRKDWHGARSSGMRPEFRRFKYLEQIGVLDIQPLLAHCIRFDDSDIETLRDTESKVAHCPKSNAKLGHGRAPLARFFEAGIAVGFGSDSVASNNTCDILEEARFATLMARGCGDVDLCNHGCARRSVRV